MSLLLSLCLVSATAQVAPIEEWTLSLLEAYKIHDAMAVRRMVDENTITSCPLFPTAKGGMAIWALWNKEAPYWDMQDTEWFTYNIESSSADQVTVTGTIKFTVGDTTHELDYGSVHTWHPQGILISSHSYAFDSEKLRALKADIRTPAEKLFINMEWDFLKAMASGKDMATFGDAPAWDAISEDFKYDFQTIFPAEMSFSLNSLDEVKASFALFHMDEADDRSAIIEQLGWPVDQVEESLSLWKALMFGCAYKATHSTTNWAMDDSQPLVTFLPVSDDQKDTIALVEFNKPGFGPMVAMYEFNTDGLLIRTSVTAPNLMKQVLYGIHIAHAEMVVEKAEYKMKMALENAHIAE